MSYFWLDKHLKEWQSAIAGDRKPQAVIINGPQGLGKQQLVSAIVNDLLCRQSTESPCGQCQNCLLLAGGHHPDVIRVAPEKNVIKVDMIREVTAFFTSTPHCSDYKLACLTAAETMNVSAANALLKVLEEPPGRGLLFLLTDNKHQLMPTIRSRCISLDVHVNQQEQQPVLAWLSEQSEADPQAVAEAWVICDGQPLTTLAYLEAAKTGTFTQYLDLLLAALAGQTAVTQVAKSMAEQLNINDWVMLQRYCLQLAKSELSPQVTEVCQGHPLSQLIKKSPKVINTVIKIADLIQQFVLNLNTQIKTQLLLESYLIEIKTELVDRR